MTCFKRLDRFALVTEEFQSESGSKTNELEVLMRRYQQADADAASLLVRKLSPLIFNFYLQQVRSRPEAEDQLQEFWLRLHRACQSYRPHEPVLPWAFAIARRVQVDHYRRSSRIKKHELYADNLSEMAGGQRDAAPPFLDNLLATLPAAQKEVVLLLKETGLSLEEVARATGTTVGAVKQKAHRAYETLRKMFGKEL